MKKYRCKCGSGFRRLVYFNNHKSRCDYKVTDNKIKNSINQKPINKPLKTDNLWSKMVLIRHGGSNLGYLKDVLQTKGVTIIGFHKFLKNKFPIKKDMVVLYQTWPDDRIFENGDIGKPISKNDMNKCKELNGKNHSRFDKYQVEQADLKFLRLPNNIKVLVDMHDDADLDAFSRFSSDDYPFHNSRLRNLVLNIKQTNPDYFKNIPRIKNTPSQEYIDNFNVILETTYHTNQRFMSANTLNKKRPYLFHYYCSDKNNVIRKKVREKLYEINRKTSDVHFNKLNKYPNDLANYLCEINVPGWGKVCFRHLDTLGNACLLLAYDDVKNTHILPNTPLVNYVDYILYNLDNLEEKLLWIKENPELVKLIRINGYLKFRSAFDYGKNAQVFYDNLLKLL